RWARRPVRRSPHAPPFAQPLGRPRGAGHGGAGQRRLRRLGAAVARTGLRVPEPQAARRRVPAVRAGRPARPARLLPRRRGGPAGGVGRPRVGAAPGPPAQHGGVAVAARRGAHRPATGAVAARPRGAVAAGVRRRSRDPAPLFARMNDTMPRFATWTLALLLLSPVVARAADQGIVVTAPAFRDAVEPLCEHRKSQGLRVRVVQTTDVLTPEEIVAGDAKKLREHVNKLCRDHKGTSYVLLVGAVAAGKLDDADKKVVPAMAGTAGRLKGEASDKGYGRPDHGRLPHRHP